MIRILILCFLVALTMRAQAQIQRCFSPQIRSLQVVANGNPLLPPVVELGGNNRICISFDELSHEYHRYIYKVEHCGADWTPSTSIFESDYLNGFNGQPIEDYEKSLNTTLLYTHYRICFPNKDVRLRLSGNYKVKVYADEEGADPDTPILEACFSLVDSKIGIRATVSSNTDIDFNRNHQQLSFALNFATLNIADPHRELYTVITQNRRPDLCVVNPKANIRQPQSIEFTHNRNLIFEAGNEYRKFEILDVHNPSLHVEEMEWFDPFYHATLYTDQPETNYTYNPDQNGVCIIRNTDNTENNTTSEYLFVHFSLKRPEIPGGAVYVNGQWAEDFDKEHRMTYNASRGVYEATLLLKQGYYNYQYVFVPDGQTRGQVAQTEGSFYATENEYSIFVYHRAPGARYDQLVGHTTLIFNPNN